jgi:mono/diheme cytochrome c family protein
MTPDLEKEMTVGIFSALFMALLTGFVSIALLGCSQFGSGRKAQEIASGQRLFQMHCGGCHNGKELMGAKQAPLLNGIFQRPSLPSGAPATDDQVRSTILEGRSGIMPPFQDDLSSQDISDIIEYLHSLKTSQTPESSDSAS